MLKLTLLRDRCRDEVPIISSSELFIDNNRSNKIGSCRTGIHVIAVSKVITDLALVQVSACQSTGWKFKKQMIIPIQGKAGQSIRYQFPWCGSTRLWLTSVRAHRMSPLSWNPLLRVSILKPMIHGGNELQWLARNSNSIIRFFSGLNATLQETWKCNQKNH